jgi:acyl transferase domain-containing protein/aryl carrier-like protein
MQPEDLSESDIAIVGMAGRFPGAPDVDTLWRRVRNGDDCLVDLDPDDLIAAGLPPTLVHAPDYVRRAGIMEGIDQFDPGFFGIGKRDAAIMDPQHRHLLEVVWESIESSGYVPERFDGAVGVFVGCGVNTYLINNLLSNPQMVDQIGWFLLRHTANDKDFLSTGISYRLDLRGPSVNVQTACSTSLVAIHLAVQSLLSFECDMAIAGGSTIDIPSGRGYTYQEGEVLSPDGHCRAFDAQSGGTVLTPGAGAVALRRLQDAYRDGDPILAVVKGTAVNNDGARKVGFFAPSVDGHADVVKEALAVAGLSGRDIQLLEAHGTGTAVGDPIEVAALTEAFRASTDERGFCRLTSTKPNIGHLDTAAGVASVIKVVQAMRHRVLPPMANHTGPSPLIDFESTPFFVSAEEAEWPGDAPRRAGISSLGVGGTNAHVILEEAPPYEPTPPAVPEQVLALSGTTAKAADDLANRIADHLEAEPDTNLADVAYTLAVGRRAMPARRVVVATDVADAITQLRTPDRRRSAKGTADEVAPAVVFMFPGGGAQYAGMGGGLDDRFGVYHEAMREGIEHLRARHGIDLAPLLDAGGDLEAAAEELRNPSRMLPAVFLTSVALAKQWMAWGVTPRGFIGHSLGEYTAAHLAGVMSLDTALEMIATRSRLIEKVAGAHAAMLVVPLPEAEVVAELPPELSLATVNAFDECVVSGPRDVVEAFSARLAEREVECQLVPVAAAGHSSLLDPILPEFHEAVSRLELRPPTIPCISNLTGTWITAEQATSPQYWVDHLRHTVRFADGLATALDEGPTVLVELGPGQALSSAARRQTTKPVAVIPALRHPKDDIADTAHTLGAFARMWAFGVPVALERFAGEGRRRLRLPTYPFQHERYWIEPGAGGRASTSFFAGDSGATTTTSTVGTTTPSGPSGPARIADLDDWFWEPTWIERPLEVAPTGTVGPWLLVGDDGDSLVAAIADQLRRRGELVTTSMSFDASAGLGDARAVAVVGGAGRELLDIDRVSRRWLGDAVDAARELGRADAATRLAVVTRGATAAGGVATRPVDALALGAVLVAPGEYESLQTVLVDLETEAGASAAAAVADELLAPVPERVVARRGGRRLVPELSQTKVASVPEGSPTFRNGGTYVVTGALGGIGHVLARHLASAHQANLVVVSSAPVPHGEERERWLQRHGHDDPTSRRIRRVMALEALGGKVAVVTADLGDPDAVRRALDDAERVVGHIDGAVHAAGVVNDQLIEMVTAADHESVVGPKARAAVVLADELDRRGADQLVLVSSTSTALAPNGQTSYVAANAVLDALAGTRGRLRIITIDYGVWAGTGKAAELARRIRLGIDDGEPISHPVLAERTTRRNGVVELTGSLDARHDWVVDEHRVNGVAVLPGTAHLDLLLSGVALAGLDGAGLRDVVLFDPLVVPDDRIVAVRVTVTEPDGRGVRTVRIESDRGHGHSWHVHSEAEVAPDATARRRQPLDLGTIEARCGLDGPDPLASPRRRATLGSRWDTVMTARLGDAESFGRLRLQNGAADDADAWTAHPGLVDVATALGVLLGAWDDPDVLYIPAGYDAVTSWAPLPAEVAVHAVRTAASNDEMLVVDFVVADPNGEVLLAVDGLALRPLHDAGTFGLSELPDDEGAGRSVAPLLALAEDLGIREEEGPELLERLVAAGAPRLVASSVDLDALREPEPTEVAAPTGATATAAAATVEDAITAMWRELLGLPDVAHDDDFFDMGGHSLIAIRLMARIHRELGVRFQLATLFEAPTIAALAELVRAERPDIDAALAAAAPAPESTEEAGVAATDEAASAAATASGPFSVAPATSEVRTTTENVGDCLIPVRRSGDKEPFFVVHGAGGNVIFLSTLGRAMPEDRPVYGFQAKGVNKGEQMDPSIEAMAARYVAALRAFKPGPYLLGGYSGGGMVALEMAHQLQQLGEQVRYLVLFDSIPQDHVDPSPWERRRNLARNVARFGTKAIRPYVETRLRHRMMGAGTDYFRDDRLAGLGFDDVEEFGIVDLFDDFTAVAERYKMRDHYDVDALLVKAGDVWPMQPYDYHLTRYVRSLDVAVTPHEHRAMFTPECVKDIVDLVVPALDAHEPPTR